MISKKRDHIFNQIFRTNNKLKKQLQKYVKKLVCRETPKKLIGVQAISGLRGGSGLIVHEIEQSGQQSPGLSLNTHEVPSQ